MCLNDVIVYTVAFSTLKSYPVLELCHFWSPGFQVNGNTPDPRPKSATSGSTSWKLQVQSCPDWMWSSQHQLCYFPGSPGVHRFNRVWKRRLYRWIELVRDSSVSASLWSGLIWSWSDEGLGSKGNWLYRVFWYVIQLYSVNIKFHIEEDKRKGW